MDEGGNFDFSPKGTCYFTITSVTMNRPFGFYGPLACLKYDLIERGIDIEYFHATEDKQKVRNQVFKIVTENLSNMSIDSIVVDKKKTNPSLRDIAKFYPKMVGYLLRYVCQTRNLKEYTGIIVITDAIPVRKKRKAVEKAIKTTLAPMIKSAEKPYQLLHHDSKSSFGLQVADYCNWAIFRKWESQDLRSYELIKAVIKNEFNIFETGETYYY